MLVFRGLARISWLARRIPLQKPAALTALFAGAIYLVISGASVSTQRAFIMAAFVFTAILIDRHAISLRTFAFAMIVVIVLRPDSVLSPGFQMSFAATGVLIAVYEAWREKRISLPQGIGSKPAFAIKSLFITSVAAGIATAPFAFYHFDRVAPFGLIANLVAMPIISFVSAPAAALTILLTPFGGAEIGLRIFGWSLEWVLAIAHWNAGLAADNGPQWKPMPELSLALFSLSIGAFIMLTGRARRLAALCLSVIAFAMWLFHLPATVFWAPSGEVFVRQNGGYSRIEFAELRGLAPLRYKDAPVTGYCKSRRCLVDSDHGSVLLIADATRIKCADIPERTIVLSANVRQQSCANLMTKDDLTRKGGAAFWIKENGVQIIHAKICGNRPWQKDCPA